jgi:PadR family transcriptional regulator PadR
MRIWVSQLRKGLIELCVMAALRRGEGYGYEIVQRLKPAVSLGISESTVYPILARLAKDELVRVRTVPSPSGPPRRYYRLTAEGRKRLGEMEMYWRDIRAEVDRVREGVVGGERENELGKQVAERRSP